MHLRHCDLIFARSCALALLAQLRAKYGDQLFFAVIFEKILPTYDFFSQDLDFT